MRIPIYFDALTDSALHSVGLDYRTLTQSPTFPFAADDLTIYHAGIRDVLSWTIEEWAAFEFQHGSLDREVRWRLFDLLPRMVFGEHKKGGIPPPEDLWKQRIQD